MTDAELRSILTDRLAAVRGRMAEACRRAGRDEASVTLVAVTKTVSARVIGLLPELGTFDLGESRPQALWSKAAELGSLPIRWHMIGHLQRNKVERTLPLVHLFHSIDSERLLNEVAATGVKLGRRPRVLLQMNASHEEQKHGFDYAELRGIRGQVRSVACDIVGLMGMAALASEGDGPRQTFAELRAFWNEQRAEWPELTELSMGMSGDFETAIEEGATLIRVGSTLFEGLEGE